jgi:hypothetical protein
MIRIPAPVVAAGIALDRADTLDELETLWKLNDCDGFRGKSRDYLMSIYRGVVARCKRNAETVKIGRAA